MSAWEAGTWPGDWKRMAEMRSIRIANLERQLAEAREVAIQLRDITRTVAANRYGSSGFADEARIRSERADAILGEKGAA